MLKVSATSRDVERGYLYLAVPKGARCSIVPEVYVENHGPVGALRSHSFILVVVKSRVCYACHRCQILV